MAGKMSECENLSLYDEMRREPWQCSGCGKLIYCVDYYGYPTHGAPFPNYLSVEYPRVCEVCFVMVTTIRDKDYWKKLQEKETKHIGRLKPGANYFT